MKSKIHWDQFDAEAEREANACTAMTDARSSVLGRRIANRRREEQSARIKHDNRAVKRYLLK
jgi:hypothetical protein